MLGAEFKKNVGNVILRIAMTRETSKARKPTVIN